MFTFKLRTFVFPIVQKSFRLRCKNGVNQQVIIFRRYASLTKNVCNVQAELHTDSDSDNESVPPQDFTDLKLQILNAGLQFVPEHGWSQKSLALGAESLGLSSASHSLIQDGGVDLIHYFNISCNEKLEVYLKEKYSSNIEKIDIQTYLEDALESRLRMVIPYISKWPEAGAMVLTPLQFPIASKNLLDLVDIIWYYAGERSLDLTWYSKRVSLALVYKMCELSLIQDKSPEFSDTFDFLRRRVETVIESSNVINEVSSSAKHLPKLGAGALITMRNLLGANRFYR